MGKKSKGKHRIRGWGSGAKKGQKLCSHIWRGRKLDEKWGINSAGPNKEINVPWPAGTLHETSQPPPFLLHHTRALRLEPAKVVPRRRQRAQGAMRGIVGRTWRRHALFVMVGRGPISSVIKS